MAPRRPRANMLLTGVRQERMTRESTSTRRLGILNMPHTRTPPAVHCWRRPPESPGAFTLATLPLPPFAPAYQRVRWHIKGGKAGSGRQTRPLASTTAQPGHHQLRPGALAEARLTKTLRHPSRGLAKRAGVFGASPSPAITAAPVHVPLTQTVAQAPRRVEKPTSCVPGQRPAAVAITDTDPSAMPAPGVGDAAEPFRVRATPRPARALEPARLARAGGG
jgi:hypothetical protein